jgi:hypothetical protein
MFAAILKRMTQLPYTAKKVIDSPYKHFASFTDYKKKRRFEMR